MGIFSWAMKGVNVEHRRKTVTEEPTAVVLEQPEDIQACEETQEVDLQQRAHSILFGDQPLAAPSTGFASQIPTYPSPQAFNSIFEGNTLGNRHILIITPRTNAEVTTIVQHLKNGEACIVTLEDLPIPDAQRRIDFLSGVVCALNGIIKPLDADKYILTPSGVGVRN